MAYSFNGTDQYLSLARGLVANGPLGISLFYRPNALVTQTLASIKEDASVDNFTASMQADGVNRQNWQVRSATNNLVMTTSASSVAAGRWHHFFGFSDGAGSHGQYINAGDFQSSALTSNPTGCDLTSIGANTSGGALFAGAIAEVSFWKVSVAHAAAVARMLASGKSAAHPELRRGLVAYLPLRADGVLQDRYSGLKDFCGNKWTANGASFAPFTSHPRVTYPPEMLRRRRFVPAGGGASTPVGRVLSGLLDGGSLVGGRLVA